MSKFEHPLRPPEILSFVYTPEEVQDNVSLLVAQRLTATTVHYLSDLGWPLDTQVAFARLAPRWEHRDKDVMYPATKNLHLTMRQGTAAPMSYDVDAHLSTTDGIVDRAEFTVAKFEHEGFIVPWALSVTSLSRTVFPRKRSKQLGFKETTAQASASACMGGITREISRIRCNKLMYYAARAITTPRSDS